MSYLLFPNPTPVFPTLPPLTWSVYRKIISSSRVTIGATGREVQLATAVFPRWTWTLTYGGNSWLRDQTQNIVTDPSLAGFTELQQLSSLFLACRGSYGEFFYDDPQDDSRSGAFCGITDGTNTSFTPVITWGNGPFTPQFFFPNQGIASIETIYFNGAPQVSVPFSLDVTRTVLTIPSLASRPGITVTIDFAFYYRCRFSDDNQKYSQFSQNRWEVKQIMFESVKP